jgi:hypothetical protein
MHHTYSTCSYTGWSDLSTIFILSHPIRYTIVHNLWNKSTDFKSEIFNNKKSILKFKALMPLYQTQIIIVTCLRSVVFIAYGRHSARDKTTSWQAPPVKKWQCTPPPMMLAWYASCVPALFALGSPHRAQYISHNPPDCCPVWHDMGRLFRTRPSCWVAAHESVGELHPKAAVL